MRSPLRVKYFSDLDQNEDSSSIFPRVWCQALAMGSPVSGRVAYFCALDRNEGFFHPPILRCFAIGSPMGRMWFSSHLIEMKSSLDSWSVFLQDGVTLFGSVSNNLISIERITSVGLLGAFFWPILGVNFCHPGVGQSALKSGGVPHSVVLTSGAASVCIPLANEGLGLGPSSSSGPVASHPPLAGRSASVV